jgi:sugar-specific transcriptional regulator TrmB
MTQIEFENQMRELRTQKGAALTAIARLQGDVKEQIAAIDRKVKELKAEREKLNQQRITLSDRRFALEQEWGKRIKEFQDANFNTTRELENVSEWTLANELRKRGYSGTLTNLDKDPDFIVHLNQRLNGKADETEG